MQISKRDNTQTYKTGCADYIQLYSQCAIAPRTRKLLLLLNAGEGRKDHITTAMDAFEPIVAAERHLVQYIHEQTKFPEDQLKTVLCMAAAFPLGFFIKYLPNVPVLKHLLNIALGLFFCIYTLGLFSWVHLAFSSFVAYLLLLFLPAKSSHIWVFLWAMGYMSVRYYQYPFFSLWQYS